MKHLNKRDFFSEILIGAAAVNHFYLCSLKHNYIQLWAKIQRSRVQAPHTSNSVTFFEHGYDSH